MWLGNHCIAQPTYTEIEVKNGGEISGVVHCAGTTNRVEQFAINKDEKICGKRKPSCRIAFGKNFGVRNAVVFLDEITEGKKITGNMKPILNQQRCEYVPHVMVVPVGAQLEIVNSDPILHNVHAYESEVSLQTLFNIAQPIRGQRTAIKQTQLNNPGIVYMRCDAGHPWMNAFVLVAPHPYYCVTDENGNFTLDNVPPGRYKIKMWHEGVVVMDKEIQNGVVTKYSYEHAYESVKEATVQPNGKAVVNFDLTLR